MSSSVDNGMQFSITPDNHGKQEEGGPLDLTIVMQNDNQLNEVNLNTENFTSLLEDQSKSVKRRPSCNELAFGVFIRKLTQDLLDYRLPINHQSPRRLLEIEEACAKHFPQFDSRQIRLKIRAQLKLLRRNMKKVDETGKTLQSGGTFGPDKPRPILPWNAKLENHVPLGPSLHQPAGDAKEHKTDVSVPPLTNASPSLSEVKVEHHAEVSGSCLPISLPSDGLNASRNIPLSFTGSKSDAVEMSLTDQNASASTGLINSSTPYFPSVPGPSNKTEPVIKFTPFLPMHQPSDLPVNQSTDLNNPIPPIGWNPLLSNLPANGINQVFNVSNVSGLATMTNGSEANGNVNLPQSAANPGMDFSSLFQIINQLSAELKNSMTDKIGGNQLQSQPRMTDPTVKTPSQSNGPPNLLAASLRMSAGLLLQSAQLFEFVGVAASAAQVLNPAPSKNPVRILQPPPIDLDAVGNSPVRFESS